MKRENTHNWLAAFKDGRQYAFDRVFNQYSKALFVYAYNLIGDHFEAEEAVNDTFCTLWFERNAINDELHLKDWLYLVVFRKSIDRLRSKKSQKHDIVHGDIDETLPGKVDQESDYGLILADLSRFVEDMLSQLSPTDREIVNLRYGQGLRIKEIAEALNMKDKTVETYLTRALRKLRIHLGGKRFDVAVAIVYFLIIRYLFQR